MTTQRPTIAIEGLTPKVHGWYLLGWEDGYVAGAQAAERDIATAAVNSVRAAAAYPPRDELEELRGNPGRAQAIRDYWALTGLRQTRPAPVPVDPRVRQAFINRCRASWGLPTLTEVAA